LRSDQVPIRLLIKGKLVATDVEVIVGIFRYFWLWSILLLLLLFVMSGQRYT
jgi:hypothetical protein